MINADIVDIQIRLNVTIDGVLLVASWYGPKDDMRFARVKSANRLLTPEEIVSFEAQGKEIFIEKIKQLEKVFKELM